MTMNKAKYSELTFQGIVEATPNAIILVNKEGRISYVNNQTEKLFGYDRAGLVGQGVEILIPDRYHKDHPQFRNMFFSSPETRAMGSGRELFAVKKDKTEFPVEIGLNPMVTIDGTMVLASIIDISARKKAEKSFRLVVESAPNAMILTNKSGVITLVNNQTEKLFGYDRKELIGNVLEIFIPKRFRKLHPQLRNDFFASPVVRAMGAGRELFAVRKDGSEFPVEIGLNPIETEEGTLVLASVIDITERKKQKQLTELEARNKELEQFNYIASHDLQEPLRTVLNYIQILEEDYFDKMDEEAMRHLDTINRAAKRMSSLVHSLLDFSRVGRNKELVFTDCNQLVNNVIADLNATIKSSKVKITLGQLPVIKVLETEMTQLFQNLINNAIKFRKENVVPEVEIRYSELPTHHEFSVSDNGIGIEQKNFEKIFYIFNRLNLNDPSSEYGIGLANCRKIVELHSGKIWVESEVGIGSAFRFTIAKL